MYVLDTNAFYYASGISECTYDVEKLRTLIDSNECFISSTSLFEFLVKYRNDIDTIHKVGEFLWTKRIKLASNVINPLPQDFSGDIMNITGDELENLCDFILKNKIDVESRFISILFDMCLFSGFYFSAYSKGNEPSEFCFNVFQKTYKMFAQINLDVFTDMFREGYKTDNCENYIKNSFYNLLAFELEKGIPFIERAKAVVDKDGIPDIDEWVSVEDYSSDTKKLNNKMQAKKSTAFLQRLAVTYWKNNNDPELKQYIRKIKGIDVSSWQGNIDFGKVKASGIDFVIIRAGYGRETRQNDNCFEVNYRNAKAAGLDVGAYWYSYADSAEDAVKEAKACMEVIKGKKFEYPIYFDLEEQSQFAKGRNFCDSVIKAFCGELEKNGYLAGLYCSTYYLNNYISNAVAGKYALWVAQYNYRCTYTANKYGIWQYSSEGRINGISGNVDMDYCYTNYPIIVKAEGYNGYRKAGVKKASAYKTTATGTSAKKTVDELAKEVIAGKWAAGDERKQKLTEAGYDYSKVQARVNELMAKPKLKTVDEIAKEVIQGKWSAGDERKLKLTAAGYDYSKVQARVNELMKNQ